MENEVTAITSRRRRSVFLVIIVAMVIALAAFFILFKRNEKSLEFLYTEKGSNLQAVIFTDRDYEQALVLAGEAVKANKEDSDAWRLKGIAEFELGKYRDARQSFQKSIEVSPQSQSAVAARSYIALIDQMESPGVHKLNPLTDDLTEHYVVEKLDLDLSKEGFVFKGATRLSELQGNPVNFTAAYTIDQGSKFAAESLRTLLKNGKVAFEEKSISGSIVFSVRLAGTSSEEFMGYSITLNGASPVDATVYYKLFEKN